MSNQFTGPEWIDISSAPRDGRLIIVADPEVGSFPMRWDEEATNWISPTPGMWVMCDGSATWSDADGFGPTKWRPLEASDRPVHVEAAE